MRHLLSPQRLSSPILPPAPMFRISEPPAPKFAYLASSWRSCAPPCAILPHLGALGPHLVAKLLQDGALLAHHSPTSRQDDPTWPPKARPGLPKTFKSVVLSSFLGFPSVLAGWRPRSKKSHQDAPKKTISCLS